MTKQERVSTLRNLKQRLSRDDISNPLTKTEEEALNWAIKECQKNAQRGEAEKQHKRGFYY